MGAAASSSSYSSYPAFSPKKYDVFISFRGDDTRINFTSHLHTALCKENLETYIDNRLRRGDDISEALLQAIKDSSIYVVVFSENYASSKWCLDELTQILQCKKDQGSEVIPVFFKVDPSDIRKQKGPYKEALAKHRRDFRHNQDKLNKWRDALVEAANISGWDSRTSRDESDLIQNIVEDVLEKLGHRYGSSLKGLVGIDRNCQYIERLLKNIAVVGIWGMGGIGKTTMAKAVFAKLSSEFESCCFLENVREESEKHGPGYVRDKLISVLLGDKNPHGRAFFGSTLVMRRLSSKKVLIVLDDVCSSRQLDDLGREYDCLGPESRVILTTRNRDLLIGRVNEIYEAKALSLRESLKLFSLKAFHRDYPRVGYEQLSNRAVEYAKGVPLALTVLGSFLHSKTTKEWDNELANLKSIFNEDIQNVLILSYNGLRYEEKQMFLDIACFMKGDQIEDIIRLHDSPHYRSNSGMRTLLDRALITIDDGVRMHDLIQRMGREIVRQECIRLPERRSRLWDPEEIYDILKNNRGTDAIEGIMIDESLIGNVNLSIDTFTKMPNLRFLKKFSSSREKSIKVNVPFGLERFCDRLKYFYWDNYPLESLPVSIFLSKDLVEIHMKSSKFRTLWEGVRDFVNLKAINLRGSSQLLELPDFSKAQNLEFIDLSYCDSLSYVHPSILSLPKLETLLLKDCSKLKSLQSETPLESLTKLDLSLCRSLNEFSLCLPKLRDLDLSDTEIERLRLSTGLLRNLRTLFLNGLCLEDFSIDESCCMTSLEVLALIECGQVVDRPKLHILFEPLRSLKELYLEECGLSQLPQNFSALSSLHTLSLRGSNVESIPNCIKHFSKLKIIQLQECKRLRSLPELPPSLSHLDATNCSSLETAFTSPLNYKMKSCLLVNCSNLDDASLLRFMESSYFSMMRMLYFHKCMKKVYNSVCYPGSRVPEWFGNNRTTKASITVKLALPFLVSPGFVFCVVLSQSTSNSLQSSKLKRCSYLKYRFYLQKGGRIKDSSEWKDCQDISVKCLNSDHVLLWYETYLGVYLQDSPHDTKITFIFNLDGDLVIKEYGVCPIYASEYHKINEEHDLFKKSKEFPTLDASELYRQWELETKGSIDQTIEELISSTVGNGVGQ